MLKINTKKARENLHSYIRSIYRSETLSVAEIEKASFTSIATNIYNTFCAEYGHHGTAQASFIKWASGLPLVIDCNYYFGGQAITDLGHILEVTEEERTHYTSRQAEEMLSRLIYREIMKEVL